MTLPNALLSVLNAASSPASPAKTQAAKPASSPVSQAGGARSEANRQAGRSQSDDSFNQMLSRQMQQRQDSKPAAGRSETLERQQEAARGQAGRSAESQAGRADAAGKTQDGAKPAEGGADTASAEAGTGQTGAQAQAAAAGKDAAPTTKADDAARLADAPQDTTMSPDLAALVASLMQIKGAAASATGAGEAASADVLAGQSLAAAGKRDSATLAMLMSAAGRQSGKDNTTDTAGAATLTDDGQPPAAGGFDLLAGAMSGAAKTAGAAPAAVAPAAAPIATTEQVAVKEALPGELRAATEGDPKLAGKTTADAGLAASAATSAPVRAALENLTSSTEQAKPLAVDGVSTAATPAVTQASTQAARMAATSAQAATTALQQKLGSDAWNQALGQKVVWMAAGGEQTATLTLNPPDLGPLQVVLSLNNTQANASFSSAQPEVRQALEAAMPKLREMLGDAGIQLGQASVDSGAAQQQQQDQAARFARSGGRGNQGADGPTGGNADGGASIARVSARGAAGGNGLVDTFA